MSGATGTIEGLTVKQAMYGVGPSSWTDVTSQTQSLIQDGNLNFTVSSQAFGIIDPAPGVKKTFQGLISINGGKPSLLTKDDTEVFDLSAPTLDKKEKPNHPGIIASIIFYFLVSLIGVYFAYSSYRLVDEGFGWKGSIWGILFAAMILGGFVSFGAADVQYGVLGLLFSTPSLIFSLLMVVFLVLCYDLNFIDFSYLKPAQEIIQKSIPTVSETDQFLKDIDSIEK
jgi:hypothetical protein